MMKKVSTFAGALAVVLVGLVAQANAALAQTVDPTGGAYTTTVNDTKSWITTVGIPVIFGLVFTVVVFAVAVKWLKGLRGHS